MNRRSVIAALCLLLLSSPALGQFIRREGGLGDKIVGNISPAGETDMFVSRAVKGSTTVVKLVPKGKTPYRATILFGDAIQAAIALHRPGEDFTSMLETELINITLLKRGRGLKTDPFKLDVTGPYRIMVSAAVDDAGNPFPGNYLLKTKVRPPRKLLFERTYDAELTAEIPIDVLPGSIMKVIVRPGPGSSLPEVVDFLDPDGASLLAGLTVKTKKKSVGFKTGALEKFGTHTLKLRAESFGSLSAVVKIRPPKTKGVLIEHLDAGPPGPDPVKLSVVAGEPLVLLPDESGGANRLRITPGRYRPGNEFASATVIGMGEGEPPPQFAGGLPLYTLVIIGEPYVQVVAEGGGANAVQFRPGMKKPAWFSLFAADFTETDHVVDGDGALTGFKVQYNDLPYSAVVSEITYTDDADAYVTSFRVVVETDTGDGTSFIHGITRDAQGLPTGWTDTRTFGPSGSERTYTLTIRDLVREGGEATSFMMDFEDPDGPHVPVPYPLEDAGLNPIYGVLQSLDREYRGTISDILYSSSPFGSLVSSFLLTLKTPDGPGQCEVTGLTRDQGHFVSGWTEVRTYGEGPGARVYTLSFWDLRRIGGEANGFRVDVTGPEGPLGTFPFPPWRLTPEDEPGGD
ncbi:MAG: hypothetical protein ACYS99_15435 [Planctomycetota bacterium]